MMIRRPLLMLMLALPAAMASAQIPDSVPAPVSAPVGGPPPTTKTAEAAADDKANEMICRKTLETASLVKQRKTCHTRSQWAYIEQENKRMGQQFILDNQGKPPGGN